jgi:hypothetical protein
MGRAPRFSANAAAVIIAVSILAIAVPGTAASAGSHPKIGPHQVFTGLVNGKRGTPDPVRVFVACHGPKHLTGHPLGTVEVLPAASVASSAGNTGDTGTSITAFFGAPPPDAHANVASRTTTVTFDHYDVAKPMPKALNVPCSGTSQVTFIAFPRTPPTSRPAVVHVEYMPAP